MKHLNNYVENYLKENIGKNLSVKTIKKALNMKRRAVIFFIHKSKFIKNVDPLILGCNKKFVNVYCYLES